MSNNKRVCVVLFHTEGLPHDNGLALGASAGDMVKRLAGHVDSVYMHTPRTLADDPWWSAHFDKNPAPENALKANPGAHHSGYFKFKPLIMLRAMEKEPDGTIIVYQDSNVHKYPQYAYGVEDMRATAEKVLEASGSDIWIGYENPGVMVKHACKALSVRRVCEKMTAGTRAEVDAGRLAGAVLEHCLLNCARIVIRNTPAMREMVRNELLPFFESDELLARLPDPDPHPQMWWHSGDQGIWNAFVFVKKHLGALPAHWPGVWAGVGRRFVAREMRTIPVAPFSIPV